MCISGVWSCMPYSIYMYVYVVYMYIQYVIRYKATIYRTNAHEDTKQSTDLFSALTSSVFLCSVALETAQYNYSSLSRRHSQMNIPGSTTH